MKLLDIREKLYSVLAASGIKAQSRSDSNQLWDDCQRTLSIQSVLTSRLSIDYYIEYERGNGRTCEDLSCLLTINKEVIALWPLSINQASSENCLASPGGYVSSPQFLRNVSVNIQSRVVKACYNACLEIASLIDQQKLISSCFSPSISTLSHWQIYAMQKGASCSARHEALINLKTPIDDIKRGFRKSYKSLINKSEKIWQSRVVQDHEIDAVWTEFQSLHLAASGRKTRSDQSWSLQKQAVVNDEAFLVAVFSSGDSDHRLIGAGLFLASKYCGLYAVGAYDRTLFDQPVSHIVQLRAIEELQRRGCEWYHIGRCYFMGDTPKPSNKDLSISLFKTGFANHFSCTFELTHSLD